MKKFAVLLLMFVGIYAFAQKPQDQTKSKPNFTPEQKAELATKKLALNLDLSEKQIKQVRELELKNAQDNEKFRAEHKEKMSQNGNKPSDDELFKMQSQRLDKQLAHQSQMKAILLPEQFEKWKELRNSNVKKMNHKRNLMMEKKNKME